MSVIEVLTLAFETLWAHKLRSFLTLLGVIFGVASVIVVVSLIEGFNKYIDEKISNFGTNAIAVQQFAITDIALDETGLAARQRRDASQGFAGTVAEIVQHQNVLARSQEFQHGMRADIAGPAGHQ